jgi:hypothetical protein
MFWFYLQILSEKFFILRRLKRHMTQNVYRSSCKVSVILVRFHWKMDFLDRFSKTIKYQIWLKVCPVSAKFSHADGRTDSTKIIVALRNFAKAISFLLKFGKKVAPQFTNRKFRHFQETNPASIILGFRRKECVRPCNLVGRFTVSIFIVLHFSLF